ncbi:MAG: SgcJ/EcaC family oxidoreductase [Ardenticatenaceae bacterium]|nr:SgcJ/EcaC family oxidoreductase [Anaerolineales bacterium]MCB8942094.1 SgcJ/EcaC family oxidoreductase [Ardenticatenaceae bacterium]MCB8973119.1 SgcJ/EcaC family oxidoreductase [Ardenticatenaceae bacterium]
MQTELMMDSKTAVSPTDKQAIHDVVQALADAWNQGDSEAWSEKIVADVHHTVWNGMHIQGRDNVTAGHKQIFSTIYKDTWQTFSIRWIRFLRPDVAAVQWDAQLEGRDDIPQVRPLAILTKQQDGRWLIEIFQNTPILERPMD